MSVVIPIKSYKYEHLYHMIHIMSVILEANAYHGYYFSRVRTLNISQKIYKVYTKATTRFKQTSSNRAEAVGVDITSSLVMKYFTHDIYNRHFIACLWGWSIRSCKINIWRHEMLQNVDIYWYSYTNIFTVICIYFHLFITMGCQSFLKMYGCNYLHILLQHPFVEFTNIPLRLLPY